MMAYTPDDYKTPEWHVYNKVHGWRNYISDEVREIWDTFTDEQKAALARQANECAGREEWD